MTIKEFFHRVIFATALLMYANSAVCDDISFDYVEVVYLSDTVDPGRSADSIKGNGIGFELSLGFSPSFAMKLAVASTTFRTFQSIDVDSSKTIALGVTAHTSVASGTAIFGDVSLVQAETIVTVGTEEVSDDDTGGIVDVGLRHMVTEGFEVELMASHTNVFGYTVNAYEVSGRFFIRKKFSVGFGYSDSDDVESLFLNARMNI